MARVRKIFFDQSDKSAASLKKDAGQRSEAEKPLSAGGGGR
jgi:hypothetical protein